MTRNQQSVRKICPSKARFADSAHRTRALDARPHGATREASRRTRIEGQSRGGFGRRNGQHKRFKRGRDKWSQFECLAGRKRRRFRCTAGHFGPNQVCQTEPFAFADFTWLTGNARTKESPMDTKFFTPEIRADVDYIYDFNHPKDNTISGSSEVFRANEVQVTQLGVGGDFHYDNVRARLMTQFGLYSQTTPRNDASPSRGQWNLDNAYRYISEAYGGYHFNALHGINVDAGIFMSYIGLFSYYQFDNWTYQPSYVSSNTPWFFNGVRIQIFPTEHLKIEPWFTNGWQSYGRFNSRPASESRSFGGRMAGYRSWEISTPWVRMR